jgi:hypothetical protein
VWSRHEPSEERRAEPVGSKDRDNSAPSWQDYIRALSEEGRRFRPASLRKALEERERAGGNPQANEQEVK